MGSIVADLSSVIFILGCDILLFGLIEEGVKFAAFHQALEGKVRIHMKDGMF